MGVKAWKVKLLIDSAEKKAALEHTLAQWNLYSARVCMTLLALRRGDFGDEGRAVWEQLKATPQNYHILYCITNEPRVSKESKYHRVARAFVERHGYHDDLGTVRCESGPLWKQLIKSARERVLSHEAKVAEWCKQHEQWIEQRSDWEEDHPHYMAVRPLIDAFQQEHGATRGRRVGWRKWQDFLATTPKLAAWRGGEPRVEPLTAEERTRVARYRRRAVRRERELFFAKNPELAELDRVHGRYEREFARTAAKRRNPDGFRHRPTFTLPSLPNRPDWPRFQSNEGYKDLDLAQRTLSFRLPTGDGPAWLPLSFVSDPRLARLVALEESVNEGRTRFHYRFANRRGDLVLAQPQEVRLMRRGSAFFASIRLTLHAAPTRLPVTQAAAGKYSPGWTLKQIRKEAPDLELVTCAVDLAVRHLGAATVAREGEVFARRILHNRFFLPDRGRERAMNIPSLPEIAGVRRRIRRAQRRSGRMSPAKETCRRLWAHYRNLCKDRYKKAVAAIFSYALHNGAEVVIFEDLKMLNPDSANERGVNKALQNWNRGNIVRFAKMAAEDYGLRVVTVGAWWTSRLCSRCGEMGVRFNQGGRRIWGQRRHSGPAPSAADRVACEIDRFGQWFICPACERCVHADINASENLHLRFLGRLSSVKRVEKRAPVYEVNGRRVEVPQLQTAATEVLRRRQAGETPF